MSFEPDNSVSGVYTATSSAAYRTKAWVFIDTLPGAHCTLTKTGGYAAIPLAAPLEDANPTFIVRWGREGSSGPWWLANDYTLTVTCTLSGYSTSPSATKVVSVTP